jgi:hypothetical protein
MRIDSVQGRSLRWFLANYLVGKNYLCLKCKGTPLQEEHKTGFSVVFTTVVATKSGQICRLMKEHKGKFCKIMRVMLAITVTHGIQQQFMSEGINHNHNLYMDIFVDIRIVYICGILTRIMTINEWVT